MKQIPELETPVNTSERFMAHISHRLDYMIEQNMAIIAQNNSIIEHLSKQGNVAVTENKTEIQKPAKKTAKKV